MSNQPREYQWIEAGGTGRHGLPSAEGLNEAALEGWLVVPTQVSAYGGNPYLLMEREAPLAPDHDINETLRDGRTPPLELKSERPRLDLEPVPGPHVRIPMEER